MYPMCCELFVMGENAMGSDTAGPPLRIMAYENFSCYRGTRDYYSVEILAFIGKQCINLKSLCITIFINNHLS